MGQRCFQPLGLPVCAYQGQDSAGCLPTPHPSRHPCHAPPMPPAEASNLKSLVDLPCVTKNLVSDRIRRTRGKLCGHVCVCLCAASHQRPCSHLPDCSSWCLAPGPLSWTAGIFLLEKGLLTICRHLPAPAFPILCSPLSSVLRPETSSLRPIGEAGNDQAQP